MRNKKNRKINKDISFVSYSNLPLSQYTSYPPLASVEQFPYLQGRKATEILLQLLQPNADQNAFYKIIIDSKLAVHDNKK
jgi:LacI family transcriptional regulator